MWGGKRKLSSCPGTIIYFPKKITDKLKRIALGRSVRHYHKLTFGNVLREKKNAQNKKSKQKKHLFYLPVLEVHKAYFHIKASMKLLRSLFKFGRNYIGYANESKQQIISEPAMYQGSQPLSLILPFIDKPKFRMV